MKTVPLTLLAILSFAQGTIRAGLIMRPTKGPPQPTLTLPASPVQKWLDNPLNVKLQIGVTNFYSDTNDYLEITIGDQRAVFYGAGRDATNGLIPTNYPPVSLSVVLRREYQMTMTCTNSGLGGLAFTTNDLHVYNLDELIGAIVDPVGYYGDYGEGFVPVSAFIWTNFSASGQLAITNETSSDFEKQTNLVNELNHVIQLALYDYERFAAISNDGDFSTTTLNLLAENPQGARLVLLNRWLLHDTYGSALFPAPNTDNSGTADISLSVQPPQQYTIRKYVPPPNYMIFTNRTFYDCSAIALMPTDGTNVSSFYSKIEITDKLGRWYVDDGSKDSKPAPGDGSWIDMGPGMDANTNSIALDWSVSLGRMFDGLAAGRLRIREPGISRLIYTPACLYFNAASTNIRNQIELVTTNLDGDLRQIRAYQTFVDVTTPDSNNMILKFYFPYQVGTNKDADGIYTNIASDPFVTWTIQNPDPTTTNNLLIIESRISGYRQTNSVVKAPTANGATWTLSYGTGSNQRIETRDVTFSSSLQTTNRQEVDTIRYGSSGPVAYTCTETYTIYPWGGVITQTVVPGPPDQITIYSYYTDSTSSGYKQINEIRYPDGYWEKRLYDDNILVNYPTAENGWFGVSFDLFAPGMLRFVFHPEGDNPTSPDDANPENSMYTVYGYREEHATGYNGDSRHSVEYDGPYGAIVQNTYATAIPSSGDYDDEGMTSISSDTIYPGFDNGSSLAGSVEYDYNDDAFPGLAGHTVCIDNRSLAQAGMSCYYDHGVFDTNLNTFTLNSTNHFYNFESTTNRYPDHRETDLTIPFFFTGLLGLPDYSQWDPVCTSEGHTVPGGSDIAVCPTKSTKSTKVFHLGNLSLTENYLYLGLDQSNAPQWTLLNQTRYYVDSLGHETNAVLIDGSQKRTLYTADYRGAGQYDGELMLSETDETGLQKTYTYDGLKRVQSITIKGYGGQPDQVITNCYDAYGRTLSVTTNAAPGLVATEAWAYDLGGRLTNHVDSSGMSVSTAYSGQTITDTYPGGITVVKQQYLDRRPKSVTGSGVIPQFYSYGSPGSGAWLVNDASAVMTNVLGFSNSPRWHAVSKSFSGVKTGEWSPSKANTTNLLVNSFIYEEAIAMVSRATFSPGWLTVDYAYETDGSIRGSIDESQCSASTVYQHIELTNRFYTQINGSGPWYYATTNYVFLGIGANNNTPTVTGITLQQANGFAANVMACTWQYDADSNLTVTTTYVDRGQNKMTSVTSEQSTSTLKATNIVQSGLLMQSSTLSVGSPTRYYYDGLGRTNCIQDPLGFTSYVAYDPVHGWVTSVTDPAGNSTSFNYYGITEANTGKLKCKTDPAGKSTYYAYTASGQLYRTWGDVPYPAEYRYNEFGDLTNLLTFRGGSMWNASTWPIAPGQADNTYWTYDAASGALLQKTDAKSRSVTYTYDPLTGKLATRAWSRGVTMTYFYDLHGDLYEQEYSDGTPSVIYTNFNRAGLPCQIIDASGNNLLTYDYASRVVSVTNTSGLFAGTGITNHFNPAFGRDQFQASSPTFNITDNFGYDGYGRLGSVNSGAFTATYGYLPNSDLLQTTTCASNSTTVLTTSRAWEYGMRLSAILNQVNSSVVTSHGYEYDSRNRRTMAYLEDGSYWRYSYNDRNELTGAKRYWPDQTHVSGQSFGFAYDNIGNRQSAMFGGDVNGSNLRTISYTANELNQYTQITTPGYVNITGAAIATNAVTVNGAATDRKAEYCHNELSINNSGGPVWEGVTAVSSGNTVSGGMVVAPNNAAPVYDNDGNLTFDGTWNYHWDGENRLISMDMTNVASVPSANRVKLDFAYDYMGRRVQKTVSTWNGSGFVSPITTKFLYDGWNLIASLTSTLQPLASFMWGQDLSGTMTQAGGVGGLLCGSISGTNCFVGYDGNGNITALIDAGSKALAARYEYSPFGELIRATGPLAHSNPFRFSTKYHDEESGLAYYGYRYYDPMIGKWIGRDPLEERGGLNLLAFAANNPVSTIDIDGRLTLADYVWSISKSLFKALPTLGNQYFNPSSTAVFLSKFALGSVVSAMTDITLNPGSQNSLTMLSSVAGMQVQEVNFDQHLQSRVANKLHAQTAADTFTGIDVGITAGWMNANGGNGDDFICDVALNAAGTSGLGSADTIWGVATDVDDQ